MSNEIYGFVDFEDIRNPRTLIAQLQEASPLGVFPASESELLAFPAALRPTDNSIAFIIGDSKQSRNAEYILDDRDYDPDATIPLPTAASERLELLTSLLLRLFSEFGAIRLVVCLTVCNEVDSIQHVNPDDLADLLHADCRHESPPCRIYVVERLSNS